MKVVAAAALAAGFLHASPGVRDSRDLRAGLSRSRIFTARLVGVSWQPVGTGDDLRLEASVAYWLEVGRKRVGPEGIPLDFRYFHDTETWNNIVLAKAISGDFTVGVSMLPSRTDDADAFSDAAALCLQQAEATNDVRQVLRALVAADRSIAADSTLPEAHFNRALALEKLGLNGPAVESYRRFLELDHRSGWAAEARQRIDCLAATSTKQLWERSRPELERASRSGDFDSVARIVRAFPEQARIAAERKYLGAWARAVQRGDVVEAERNLTIARDVGVALREFSGESLLADAVQAIDQKRSIDTLVRGQVALSANMFDEAARQFDVGGSPMADLARYFAIDARFGVAKVDDSLAQLRQIRRQIAPTHVALLALVDSEIGNSLAERGDVYDALEAYTLAERDFDQLHEIEGVARMRASLAHMLTMMGQPAEAWRIRRAAFAAADRSGDPSLEEFVVGEAMADELFERNETTAMALYNAVLGRPLIYRPSGLSINGWRSMMKLMPSRVVLDSINGRTLSPDVKSEMRFAEATNLSRIRPSQAEARLTECIAYAQTTGRVLMLPYVYLYRASARLAMHKDDGAIADLRQSFALLENRGSKIRRRDLRDVWSTVADDTFELLVELYCRRVEYRRIFDPGERLRGRAFLDDMRLQVLSAEQIASRLEPGVAMIVFTSSPKHTLATVIERERIATLQLPETGALLRKKRALHSAIRQGRQSEAVSRSEELYESLIRPLDVKPGRLSRLVIVADPPLKDLAFSFLRDREKGQYLIEQFEVLHAPSASVFVQTQTTPSPARRAVTVGNPAFDQQVYPSLPSLPAAKDESLSVARRYPESRALVGAQATFENFARSIRDADVIDIAAHTAPNPDNPLLSELLLAADGQQSGACGVRKVASLPVKRGSTVVIAGCRTAVSKEPGDLRDFAGSFLAAGAGSAVATLWDVEDNAAREFSLRFHRALSKRTSAAAATRTAQLSMLRSGDAALRDPHAWSGFQVYALGR